jgi:S-DNA-T family DNA segregation ATPase FtsK/SpoIIIE
MIFEILSSSLLGALSLKAYLSKSGEGNDSKKLNKIFTLTGLNVKDGQRTLNHSTTQEEKLRMGY